MGQTGLSERCDRCGSRIEATSGICYKCAFDPPQKPLQSRPARVITDECESWALQVLHTCGSWTWADGNYCVYCGEILQ